MAEEARATALERKALAQRQAIGGAAVSLSRALGRSLSIAADALWGLGLTTQLTGDEECAADRAVAKLPDDHLMVLLDGPDRRTALVTLDRQIVTGLVEVQTLGKITTFPLDSRAFTPTDAAMTAPLLDAALPRLSTMLLGQPDLLFAVGYAFGQLVEDAQTAVLALDAEKYRLVSFDVVLAHGTRQGAMTVYLPMPDAVDDDIRKTNHGKYEALFRTIPTPVQAVLTRIHLPLSRAQALRPGDTLDISIGAVGTATLVGHGGHIVTQGKLGQMNGFRALRIGGSDTATRPPPPPPPVQNSVPQSSVTEVVPIEDATTLVGSTEIANVPSVDPLDEL